MIEARFKLDEYTTKVLDVVKGKYGLKNRNEALKKFTEEFGEQFVEPQINEATLTEMDLILEKHKNKYGNKKMSMKELDNLLGI